MGREVDNNALAQTLGANLQAMGMKEIFLDEEADRFAPIEREEGEMSLPLEGNAAILGAEAIIVSSCKKCALGGSRTHAVYGDGNENADIVFVGEAPGAEEDKQGLPFVGRAGKLLDRLLEQVGLKRKEIYICNVLKCRPPENRDPLPEEVSACRPYLDKQLSVIRPKIICCLGLYSAQAILNTKEAMARLRSGTHKVGDVHVIPTYHTAAALRFPAYKQQIYDDLCRARDILFG